MKKILLLLLMLFCFVSHGQIKLDNSNFERILFTPKEVYASGVFIINFKERAHISYIITNNERNNFILKGDLDKPKGPFEEKIDLSLLEKGYYTIKFFINTIEEKSVTFKKI